MLSKKILENYIIKPVVCAGLITSIIFSGGCTKYKQKLDYSVELAEKCMDKAAGADNIFDFEEGVEMAKGLGYKGGIFPGEKIVLKSTNNPKGILFIGYEQEVSRSLLFRGTEIIFRDKVDVSIGQMESYLGL